MHISAGEVKLARQKQGTTLRIPSANHGEVSVNMIPLIPMGICFPTHIEWPRKTAKWPSEEKVAKLRKIGINAAATTTYYWSNVFEECEKELLTDIDHDGGCRKKVLRILENLSRQFNPRDGKTVLTSRHMKVRQGAFCVIKFQIFLNTDLIKLYKALPPW